MPSLNVVYEKAWKSNAEVKPIDEVLMFKILGRSNIGVDTLVYQ